MRRRQAWLKLTMQIGMQREERGGQVIADWGEGGVLQVLELQRAMLKEADCLQNESDA